MALCPPIWYFHANRADLLASKLLQNRQKSYYNPDANVNAQGNLRGIGRGAFSHHAKELLMRLAIGYALGKLISLYMYGKAQPEALVLKKDGE